MLLIRVLQRAVRSPEVWQLGAVSGVIAAIGTVFFHVHEGLGWIDALYFTVVTLTTVGYGDISPQTDAGKLFTVVYVVLGLGIVAALIALVADLVREVAAEARPPSARDAEGGPSD